MFRRNSEFIRSNSLAVPNFVQTVEDGQKAISANDVQNSEFLYLVDHRQNFKTYTVTRFEHRFDLISKDIYGTTDYAWLIQYINRISAEKVLRGTRLLYLSQSDIQDILATI